MTGNELKKRTSDFAHRCVKLATSLPKGAVAEVCSRQLIRSATSVAANYRAVRLAQSKASFVSKLSIVVEECDETFFWIEFIRDERLVKGEKVASLLKEAEELATILITSRITATRKQQPKATVSEQIVRYRSMESSRKKRSSILPFSNSSRLRRTSLRFAILQS
jgi:four helix bundle protein